LIKLNLHEEAFNPQFKYVWQSKADFLVLYGGGGSGKSENAADKVMLRSLTEKGHRMVNFRKVGKTIRVSQWLLIKDKIKRHKMAKLWNLRETEMTATNLVNGNEILSIGMDDREKIKSLTEPTSFWINEATELDKEDFLQLIMRLRGFSLNYKQIILDFNPIDEFHWLRSYFFTPAIEDKINNTGFAESIQNIEIEGKIEQITTHILHSTWRDNAFLSQKDKAKYEMMKTIDSKYYDVYGKGLWGKIGNLVYPKGYIILPKEEYPETYNEIIYGLDFGFTAPTSLSRYGLVYEDTEKGRKIKSYKEQLIYETGLTLKDLIDRMSEVGIKPSETIYADNQDPAKIEQLNYCTDENGGYKFSVVPADKDVKNGIDFVRSVERYSCPENVDANKEVTAYRWKLDARGNPIDGEPIKYNDHSQDEERYALYTNSLYQELQMAFININ
jgi:phage terminase large subunit